MFTGASFRFLGARGCHQSFRVLQTCYCVSVSIWCAHCVHACVCVLYACLSLCECAFVPLAGCVSLRVHAVYVVARGFATEGSSVFVI